MSRVMEEMRDEAVMYDRIENALKMTSDGKLPLEDIVRYTSLPLEKIRELAENKRA